MPELLKDPGEQCPACDAWEYSLAFEGSDRLYHTTTEVFRVVQCDSCGLMRMHPRPSPAQLSRYYPQTYWHAAGTDAASRLEEWYRRVVLRDHVGFVERALRECGEPGPVLDVGCGGGLFLRLLRERGHRVVGLDFALDAAAVAWGRNAVPTVCGTLAHAPLVEGSCAGITMFHVLEHLYNPGTYLEAAHQLLKPDGRLIVQVPNASCWQFLLLGDAWTGLDLPRHLYDYRDRDLEALLEACGFEVLRKKYFSLRDNPAGLASSIAPGLDPMARRVRQVAETPRMRLLRDLAYFGLVVAALPLTLAEAACRAGSTVMIEARKKT